jgi:hypothetical protein
VWERHVSFRVATNRLGGYKIHTVRGRWLPPRMSGWLDTKLVGEMRCKDCDPLKREAGMCKRKGGLLTSVTLQVGSYTSMYVQDIHLN